MDWRGILRADPTDRLLDSDNLVVRFWTLRDILKASKGEREEARSAALESDLVQEVFSQQRPKGYWESPDNMHAPHYTSTVYQLSLLGDLGLTAEDKRIVMGVDAVLATQREDGGFPGHDPLACEWCPYDVGLVIRFMHQFGMGDNPRLKLMYDWIGRNQLPGGGWLGVKARIPGGCLNSSSNVLWGFVTAGGFSGTEVAEKGVAFLKRAVPSVDPRFGRRISYPQFWNFWLDDIKLAEIYLGIGVGRDDTCLKSCLENILSLQEKDGFWRELQGPYPEGHENCMRMRRFFPKRNEPSKWVTAKALKVIKDAYANLHHL